MPVARRCPPTWVCARFGTAKHIKTLGPSGALGVWRPSLPAHLGGSLGTASREGEKGRKIEQNGKVLNGSQVYAVNRFNLIGTWLSGLSMDELNLNVLAIMAVPVSVVPISSLNARLRGPSIYLFSFSSRLSIIEYASLFKSNLISLAILGFSPRFLV